MRLGNDLVLRQNHDRSSPLLLCNFNANYTPQGVLLSMTETRIPAKKGLTAGENVV
jgi:hypothetical protein